MRLYSLYYILVPLISLHSIIIREMRGYFHIISGIDDKNSNAFCHLYIVILKSVYIYAKSIRRIEVINYSMYIILEDHSV